MRTVGDGAEYGVRGTGGIRWVFFDAFGTLFDFERVFPEAARLVHEREGMGVPIEAFYEKWKALSRSQMDHRWAVEGYRSVRAWFGQSLADTFAHFGHRGDVEGGIEINMRRVLTARPFQEAGRCLAALAGRYELAIVSNIDSRELGELLAREDWPVSLVVTSEDAGAYKPNVAFFEYALERAGAGAGEVVHVGDGKLADVEGARRAGIRAVWVNRKGKAFPAHLEAPTFEIATLDALPALMRGM